MKAPAVIALAAALALVSQGVQARDVVSDNAALNLVRPCTPKPGAPVKVASTAGASATSAQLTGSALYVMKCDTTAWVRTAISGTCTAAVDDFKLPADTLFPLRTSTTVMWMCARNVTVDGSCWLWECQ